MDMSGMDMSGMGMDDGMSGMYPENQVYAQEYWYIIAATLGLLTTIRVGRSIYSRLSIRRIRLEPDSVPSRPTNIFSQAVATTTAILRESTYWQPWCLTGRISQFFTPPSAGRCMVLALYLLTVLTMLFQDVFLSADDPNYVYHFEKVGFRAAWINVTQIPFIYLTATKINPVTILSGISYERLNWLHRWAARMVFITVIFHWSYFFTEWYQAGLIEIELQMMPMVIYGFIAWGILGWQVLTSFGFFRNIAYELWVLQHLASAAVLLWALYMHVPAYAQYNIWMAVGFVAFDRIGRMLWSIIQNVGLLRRGPQGMSFGYTATLEALPDGYTKVRIPNIHFRWKAGQHIFLSIPRIGPLEAHPFTIANDEDYEQESGSRTINLLIKGQAGFTRRMHTAARTSPTRTYRAFISGPWGQPPNLSSYETVIFIANSTGAAFNLPLFQQIAKSRTCARNVVFSWNCKESCQISWFQNQILAASDEIQANGAKVSVMIGCTGGDSAAVCCCCAPPPTVIEIPSDVDSLAGEKERLSLPAPNGGDEQVQSCCGGGNEKTKDINTVMTQEVAEEIESPCCSRVAETEDDQTRDSDSTNPPNEEANDLKSSCCASEDKKSVSITNKDTLLPPFAPVAPILLSPITTPAKTIITTTAVSEKPVSPTSPEPIVTLENPSCSCICALLNAEQTAFSLSRPSLESIILPAVEAALGETIVVVCGRKSLCADVRNYVARLADERAVHKGSGAQGIRVWGEEFGW